MNTESRNRDRVCIAILNRNEEAGLRILIPRIPIKFRDSLFAVDGFSTDSSLEVLREHQVETLAQRAGGRGEAMEIAVKFAKDRGFSHIIFISSDGNENPDDIGKFLEFLDFDLVIASRMLPGAFNEEDVHWFRPRKWANHFFNWLINVKNRSDFRVSDCLNGFRMFKIESWERLNLDAHGYGIEFQMTLRSITNNLKVTEFPTHEGNRVGGKSGVKPLQLVIQMLGIWIRG